MDNKYALIIAIENYKDKAIGNVRFAENDAKELKNVLISIGYKNENVTLLIDDDATKTLVEAKIKRMLKTLTKNDEFLMFYAGHGFTKNNHNYITSYDTILNDLEDTSIILQTIFGQIKKSNCEKFIFLLDTCHSGLEIDQSMRDIFSEMNNDEIEEFFNKSKYYIGFASSKNDEVSHSAAALSHGIWTYHLLQVLKGEVPNILIKGSLITAINLQNYLGSEVPKTAKKYTSTGYQTPVMFGNLSREFLVADIKKIFDDEKKKRAANSIQIERIIFLSEKLGDIKKLSGFKRGIHTVPEEKNSFTENFVSKISANEVKDATDEIFERIKSHFNYSRKDIETEHGRIVTPDFEIMIFVEQNRKEPSEYTLCIELSEFTSIDILESDELNNLFNTYFDTIRLEFNHQVNIRELIDVIEELDIEGWSIDYPRNLNYLKMGFETLSEEIVITKRYFQVTTNQRTKPLSLLQSLMSVRNKLSSYNQLKMLE